MATELTTVTYTCGWTDEHGDVCGSTDAFSGRGHEKDARDSGWGRYSNAYVRRSRWTTGAALWFCPVHATVFRNNHGWGGLEDYKPPTKWWEDIFRKAAG
ncbi:hypothetical protein ACFQ9D_12070 [Arthrobacter koreensis]|uniref:hypothetical protein n=1 Tax=Arthrobacter koreensis TaxID=199136 RepID=UPI003633CA55